MYIYGYAQLVYITERSGARRATINELIVLAGIAHLSQMCLALHLRYVLELYIWVLCTRHVHLLYVSLLHISPYAHYMYIHDMY